MSTIRDEIAIYSELSLGQIELAINALPRLLEAMSAQDHIPESLIETARTLRNTITEGLANQRILHHRGMKALQEGVAFGASEIGRRLLASIERTAEKTEETRKRLEEIRVQLEKAHHGEPIGAQVEMVANWFKELHLESRLMKRIVKASWPISDPQNREISRRQMLAGETMSVEAVISELSQDENT